MCGFEFLSESNLQHNKGTTSGGVCIKYNINNQIVLSDLILSNRQCSERMQT